MNTDLPLTLRPVRKRVGVTLAVWLVFLPLSWGLIKLAGMFFFEPGKLFGWLMLVAAVVQIPRLLVVLLPGADYVTLTHDSFTVCDLFQVTTVPWDSLQSFHSAENATSVSWRYIPGRHATQPQRLAWLKRLVRRKPAVEAVSYELGGTFENFYDTGTPALVKRLNQELEHHRQRKNAARAASAEG